MNIAGKVMRYAVSAALGLAAGGTHASGFQLMEQNASGLGNAYAGQAAAAENASTIFFNPAGMTRLPGKQFSGAVNAISPSTKFSDSGASRSPIGQPLGPGGSNGGDAGDLAFVPNLYFSWQMNPRTWLGVGVSVPFGLKTEYDTNFIGRFQSQRSEIRAVDINPSIAYKVNDKFSIGGGISYQMAEVKIDRSTFTGVESFTKVKLDDDSWGFNIGALADLGANTRMGFTYRSQIKHKLTGDINVSNFGGVIPLVAARARLDVTAPGTFSWGVAHALNPSWELLGDITYTRWSKIKALPLITTSASALGAAGVTLDTFNFQFKDTYRVGIGANWKQRGNMTWKFGVAYDKSPVEDAFRTVTLPDNDRIWLAVGGKYRMSSQSTLDFGFAHLFIDDATINQLKGVGVAPLQGNVVGTYKADVNILSVQFSHSF